MTINSVGYEGTISDGEVWANLQYALGNRHFVVDAGSVNATPVLAGTRQVQIGVGTFGSWGIHDNCSVAETVTLPTVSSGTKWFLIVARRTWALLDGSENETEFLVLDPGWTAPPTTLPPTGTGVSQLNRRPGIRDDQPLWIVPLTAGDTVPGTPLDVRLIGSGNNFVANHDWTLQYANWPGVNIRRGTKLYERLATTWSVKDDAVKLLSGTAVITPSGVWNVSAPLVQQARIIDGLQCELHINARFLGSAAKVFNSVGDLADDQIGVLPAALQPATEQSAVPMRYLHATSTTSARNSVVGMGYITTDGRVVMSSGIPNTSMYARIAPITATSFNAKLTWRYILATPYPV